MMKSAEDRLSGRLAEPLDRPMDRRILVQGQLCAEIDVIKGVGSKNPAQMCLAKDDDLIEACAAHRADQRVIPNAHAGKTPGEFEVIDGRRARQRDAVARSQFSGGCGQCNGREYCSRVRGDVGPYQASP